MDQNNHSLASDFPSTDPKIIDIKQFELILGKMQEGDVEDVEFWETWCVVPGLSPAEVKFICKELVRDFELIETGQFQLPVYADDLDSSGSNPSKLQRNATAVGKKKKGIPWSKEENELFLVGLKECGKGHWKEIANNYVKSRTPTQVASHAQKYFLAEKKKLERLGLSDLPHRHQESSPAILTTFQIPPQQQGYEAPLLAPDYLLENQYNREQNLPNFSFLPPRPLDQQALPPCQFHQRVQHGALVPDSAYGLQHQPHQTGYMNPCNWTQSQFNQQKHAEPPFRAQQTPAELQSRTRFAYVQNPDSWSITSSNATPRFGSDSSPSPTTPTSVIRKDGSIS